MADSKLRLQDKTILVIGPFNGVSQAILRTMTEFGADVGLMSEHPYAGKYVDGVNEAREVHPEYGRGAHYALPMGNERQINEGLGRVAESLGRMDILIDLTPLGWTADTDSNALLGTCRDLAARLIPFFAAKQRGRIVYIYEDPSLDRLRSDLTEGRAREGLTQMIEDLAKSQREKNITVNALSVGVTEDVLLKLRPKSPSLKRSLEELQKEHVGLRLVEFHDVALGVAYLASSLSASVTGQTLRLTHGFHLL